VPHRSTWPLIRHRSRPLVDCCREVIHPTWLSPYPQGWSDFPVQVCPVRNRLVQSRAEGGLLEERYLVDLEGHDGDLKRRDLEIMFRDEISTVKGRIWS
jgi:hypothetical protein